MIYTSPMEPVAIPDVALSDYVFEHAGRWGGRTALVDASDGRSFTFAEVHDASRRFAAALLERGWRKGEVLAIVCPNTPEFAIAFHGTVMAGGVVTTVNPFASAAELAFQLCDSQARAVLTLPSLLPALREAATGSPVRDWFTLGAAEGASEFGALALDAARSTALPRIDIDPASDLAALPYSSGTTGRAKGVMLTHRNMVALLAQRLTRSEADDVYLAFLPFFHVFGMQSTMNRPLREGACCVVMRRFDLAALVQNIERYRVTHLALVPPVVNALANSPLVAQHDLGSLRQVSCGAAPLDAALQVAASERIGRPVRQGYGMTETSVGIAANWSFLPQADQSKPGSCGVLLPNMQARILDLETGEDLPPGRVGEILVRGPNVMKGYLGNPEATAAMLDAQGWMRTGDIGHFDEEGYLFVSDRLKELIKVNGHQVAPAMLEGLLLEHPGIAEAAVVGRPDAERGEVPVAFVARAPGVPVSAEEILGFIEARVASYERLHAVTFLDQIPKSPSGKLLRRQLRTLDASARNA